MGRTMMMSLLPLLLSAAAVLLGRTAAQQHFDYPRVAVRISSQPGLYSSVPAWIAWKEGFFATLGIDVSFVYYPSGAPQVEAADTWDIGDAGCVPNIIAGEQGISTIAISSDESAINAVVANDFGAQAWPPANINGVPFGVTPNSTGHYVLLKCLTQQYPDSDAAIQYLQQPDILDGMIKGSRDDEGVSMLEPENTTMTNDTLGNASDTTISNEAADAVDGFDYGALWAPFVYSALRSMNGSEIVCSGKRSGAIVPGGIMVRDEFVAANDPSVVPRVLTAWLRGVGFVHNPDYRQETINYLKEFYQDSGSIELSDADIQQEMFMRILFELDQQSELMRRGPAFHATTGELAPSTVDGWYHGVSDFLVNAHLLTEIPPESSYLTDEYLRAITQDGFLSDFVLQSNVDYEAPAAPTIAPAPASTSSALWPRRCWGWSFSVVAAGLAVLL